MSVKGDEVEGNLFARIDALFREQQYDMASGLLQGVLDKQPDHARALHAMGAISCEKGAFAEARDLISRAVQLDPGKATFCIGMGNVHKCEGDLASARVWYQRALDLDGEGDGHYQLGLLDLEAGNLDDAAAHLELAATSQPGHYLSVYQLGIVRAKRGQYEEALAHFDRAIGLDPTQAGAWAHAADLHRKYNRSAPAEELCRRGLIATSDHPLLLVTLGTTLLVQGRIDEAKECYQRALAKDPSCYGAYSCLMFALNYDPQATQEDVYQVARAWEKACCAGIPANTVFDNDRDPDRPLRIGYLSGDLHCHPVGFHLLPVLRNHDRNRFKVYCYSNSFTGDDLTKEFMTLSDQWRIVAHLNDVDAERLIRADGIDILIDLSGHTGAGRLQLLARRPAPVQVSWLGYFNTTGLSVIDYLITDDATVLPGEEHLFSEKVLRLPWSRFCLAPFGRLPDVVPPPCLVSGQVTFGSFNNLAKVNPQVVALWSKIMRELPDSRLILKRGELSDPGLRGRISELFAGHGIDPARLDLRGGSDYQKMLAEYGEVDIALDTFPFSGGLTTLDALIMGVPVVTLSGKLPISRQTRSFLRAINLLELVARKEERYQAIVCDLARDPQRLAALREELRGRVLGSYLCDGREFTGNLETAYKTMWRAWCQSTVSPGKRRNK